MNTSYSFIVYSIAQIVDADLSFGQEYFVEDCEYGELIDYLLKTGQKIVSKDNEKLSVMVKKGAKLSIYTCGQTLLSYLEQKHFTIETIAKNAEGKYFDLFDGIRDFNNGIIRCVGDPWQKIDSHPIIGISAILKNTELDPAIKSIVNSPEYLQKIDTIPAETLKIELTIAFTGNPSKAFLGLAKYPNIAHKMLTHKSIKIKIQFE